MSASDEDDLLPPADLQGARNLLAARELAEQELIKAKESLELRSAELARSLSLMRATLESTADALVVTTPDAKISDFNNKYLTMWGFSPELLETRDHHKLLNHVAQSFVDPDQFLSRIREIYETAPPETLDHLQLKDGRIVERVSRVQLLDGLEIGRVWSFRDITVSQRIEEIHARLAAIIESSDDAIVSKDLTGRIETWNRGVQRMFGYTPEEIVGKSITILIPPQRISEEQMILETIGRGQRVDHYETVRIRKDGTAIDVSLTVSPILSSGGQVIGISKIVRDITERKRKDTAIQDQTRVLELLNETGRALASTLELDDLLQIVTDAATKLSNAAFGAFFYNRKNEHGDVLMAYTLSGARLEDFQQFDHPRATPLFGPTFRGESPIRIDDVLKDPRYGQLEPHFGMPKGHLPVRSYLSAPVISRSGRVIGGLFFGHPQPGVFTDQTEQLVTGIAAQAAVAIDNAQLYEDVKRAAVEREVLLDAERAARTEAERVSLMKDEFLATVSHELRTPLNAILGWSQVLSWGTTDPSDLKQGIEAIERNARAQAQLIEDLLDMSRIVSGKVRLDIQQVDLTSIIDAALDAVRPSADAKQLRLRKVLDPRAGPVTGDPNRLQQVVWNLLSNSIKFTSRGGKIDLFLERVNSHLEITVRDSGIGIASDFLPYVFERFRQADGSTTRKHGGLGLGLSIVKQLVELHGGTVRAESAGEGHGSTFIVKLPLAPVRNDVTSRQHPTSQFSRPPNTGIDLSGIKILLVDDEPDSRTLVERVLTQCDAHVVAASAADEALGMVKTLKPDVLISDIGMPVKDGYQFIRELRRLSPAEGGKTPAVALTAFARSEDRVRAMMAGYQVHMAKPIQAQELIATVASMVGRTGTGAESA